MARPTITYLVKENRMITPRVRYISFTREDGEPTLFLPGQFITFHIEGAEKVQKRSYSLANPPGQPTIEIACTHIEGGVASSLFNGLKSGDPVTVSGPYGLLVLKDETPDRYLLIGTSTGITPYRSMLKTLEKRLLENPKQEVVVIQGVREESDLLFADDFLALDEKLPNFRFIACYSKAQKTNKPYERLGRVQTALEELNPNPQKDLVYLCGNPNMIDQNFEELTNKGFDRKSIRREKYVFSH